MAQSALKKKIQPIKMGTQVVRFIKSLKLGTWVTAQSTTDSMKPSIRIGQNIHILRASYKNIRQGDIIAYTRKRKKSILVHRVLRKIKCGNKTWFETKGDNLALKDSYLTPEDFIVGIVHIKKR